MTRNGAAGRVRLGMRLLPGVAGLRGYQRSWLRGDLLAGLAVAVYLIPQVMAYAEIAGLPAVTGLVAACGALTIYAVLGSSRQLSVGPESTTALMTAAAVAPLAGGDPLRYATLAAGLALAVGVLCLLARVARAGALADLLSKPVLVGYLAGVAVIMIVSQLGTLTGTPVEGDSVPAELASFVTSLGRLHGPTVALSALLLVVLLVGGWLRPRWPIPLIGMLVATGAVAVFSLQQYGIVVIGQAATGIPAPGVPHLSAADLGALALPALGVAVVAYSDNVLTARAFGARRSQTVDAMPSWSRSAWRTWPSVSFAASRSAAAAPRSAMRKAAAPNCTRWSRWCWSSSCWWPATPCWPVSRSRRWAPW